VDRPVTKPLPTQDSTTQKNADTHPCLERDSKLRLVFQRSKTVRATDHAAIGTGLGIRISLKYKFTRFPVSSLKLMMRNSSAVQRWTRGWMTGGSSPGRMWELFFFTTASRPALRPTQPPIEWAPGALSRGVKLTTHLHLVWRSRMRGATPQYAFMACTQLKLRDNFTLALPYLSKT
jgi:hypothetical protein